MPPAEIPIAAVSTNGGRTDEAGDTHLSGRKLLLARIGWITVTLALVILNLLAFPALFASNFTFTPQVLHELHQLNLSPTLYGVLETILSVSFPLAYLPLGLLLFLRRSHDRMALFCAFTLVTFGGGVPLYDFGSGGIELPLATNAVLRVVALLLFGVGETSLVMFFYLFPSGRFVPRWTRWVTLLVAAYYLAVIFFPTLPSNAGGPATFLVPLFLLTAAVAQVYRYRRVSTPRERQQTKWAVFGFALAMVILATAIPQAILLPSSIADSPVLQNLNPTFTVALVLIPIFIAIAILRSQLWDIDTIINKALVYGTLTALLAGVYVGLVIGLESLVGAITGKASSSRSSSSHRPCWSPRCSIRCVAACRRSLTGASTGVSTTPPGRSRHLVRHCAAR